jgi:uncharacterized protein DUF6766
MRRILRENGLSIVLFGLFFFSLGGQSIAGWRAYTEEQDEHGQPPVGYVGYLGTGHFLEAVFENWESEFLQMGLYVLLTVFLRQKGSAESKKLDGEEPVDADPRTSRGDPNAPWPVRRGGWVLTLYENSLAIALFLLFVLSLGLHAVEGAREYSQEQVEHGGQEITVVEYLGTSRFWFESFQNWQSEFLSIGMLAVLSIFLRQRGSPESKPVASPHGETGGG